MLEDVLAPMSDIAERMGLHRRTLEKWPRTEAFELEMEAQARGHFSARLLPKALRAAERILDAAGPRSDTLVIEVLRASGILIGQRLDVHHSGGASPLRPCGGGASSSPSMVSASMTSGSARAASRSRSCSTRLIAA